MGNDPNKPGGTGEGYEWDDDWPTDVSGLKRKPDGSVVEAAKPTERPKPAERPAPGDTKRYPTQPKRPLPAGAALPSFLVAYIDVLGGPDTGAVHKVTMVNTVIGRGPEADVRIKDERSSRKHATITYTEGEFRIRDQKSANGTFLNGSKVVEYAVRDGDKILIGDSLMQFHVGKSLSAT